MRASSEFPKRQVVMRSSSACMCKSDQSSDDHRQSLQSRPTPSTIHRLWSFILQVCIDPCILLRPAPGPWAATCMCLYIRASQQMHICGC